MKFFGDGHIVEPHGRIGKAEVLRQVARPGAASIQRAISRVGSVIRTISAIARSAPVLRAVFIAAELRALGASALRVQPKSRISFGNEVSVDPTVRG
jgi:hypothetical protein